MPPSLSGQPHLPPPNPTGWFAVAFSDELAPGRVKTCRIVGQDLVLFRTESGQLSAFDPHCPHLGAHLGDGCVRGETLVCPMHAFEFGTTGRCTKIPTAGRPPPNARTLAWPVREQNGVILAFHDSLRRAPEWELPPLAEPNWSAPSWQLLEFRGHPQETSENSADLLHFSVVHGYSDITFGDVRADGALFESSITFRRADFLGKRRPMRVELGVHVHGLGFSYVDVTLPDYGLKTRQFVLSTPTESDRVALRIGMAVDNGFKRSAIHPLLSLVPQGLAVWLIRYFGVLAYAADVRQDIPMWTRKSYLTYPALASGEGAIGRYRKWARQFYPESAAITPVATPSLTTLSVPATPNPAPALVGT